MTNTGEGSESDWIVNWFRIENFRELRFDFHVFDVLPLPQASDRFQRMKRLAEQMRFSRKKDKLGWIDASWDRKPVLLVPRASSVEDRYSCEIGGASKVVHELVRQADPLTLPALSESTRGPVSKILRETLRVGLGDDYRKLWRIGDRFYIISSRKPCDGYDLYRGFAYRIECAADGHVYLVIDSVTRFLDAQTLQDRFGTNRDFAALREYCSTGAAGEPQTRFAIKRPAWLSTAYLVEVHEMPCSDFRIKKDGRQTTLYEEFKAGGIVEPTDFVVGVKYYAGRDPEYFPASLVKRILDTEDIAHEENPAVLPPAERIAAIRTAASVFATISVGGARLQLSKEPLSRRDCSQLPAPTLEVKGGKKVALRWTDTSVRFAKENAIKNHGPCEPSGLKQPYLLLPSTVTSEQSQSIQAGLETVARAYGEDLKFKLFPYADAYDAARRIAEDKLSAGRGCVIILRRQGLPDYAVFKKTITNSATQCAVLSNVLPPAGCRVQEVEDVLSGRSSLRHIRGYVNRMGLVVLGLVAKAGGKPWILGEPLTYYPALGVDVGGRDSRFASYAGIMDPFGRILRAVDYQPHHDEELSEKDLSAAVLRFLADYRAVAPDFVAPSLVLYRDGEMKGDEAEAMRAAATEARSRGLLRSGAPVGLVEVRKTNPYRIFRRTSGGLTNPYPGCWLKLSESSAILATTGIPWVTDGSAQPLFLKVESVEGTLELEKVVRDVFLMSELNIATPTLPYKFPIVIALADRRASEVSVGISSSGPSF